MTNIAYVCTKKFNRYSVYIQENELIGVEGFVLLVNKKSYAMIVTRNGYRVQIPIDEFNEYFKIEKENENV